MAVFRIQGFVKHIPVTSFRFRSLPVPSNTIPDRLSFSSQIPPEETDGEIVNQILAAGSNLSVSREENCIDHIRKLCAAGNLPPAAKLLENLRGEQIFIGLRAYDYLLEVADEHNDNEMLFHIFKEFLISLGSVRLNSYLIVARAIGKRNDPAVLLNFILELCELKLPRIDIVLNMLIFALAKCGHVECALFVVDRMKSLKCKPDLVTYNTILAILGRLARIDEVLRLFEFMKTCDLIPDIVTYNTVLNSARKMGRLDLCLLYFKEMIEKGIRPDLLTYKPLIESLGRSGNIDEALRLFDEMKRKGIDPSVHIYRALIFSLRKMGKMELASKFSTEMNKLLRQSVIPRDFQYNNR